MVGDLPQIHVQRDQIIERRLARRSAAVLRVVLVDETLVHGLLCWQHVHALDHFGLWRQLGQNVLLHAPQDEWLQHVACVGDCLLRCVGGDELLGGFAHRIGVRGGEKGEEREELLEVVLHGRAGEEERVVCFDLAESLCVTRQ